MQEKPTWLQLFKNRPIDSITPPKMAKKQKLTTTNYDEEDPLQKILCWRDALQGPIEPDSGTYQNISVSSIVKDNQKEWGNDFQGILIDVDWDQVDFEEFRKLKLGEELMDNGIVFIWGSCSNIGELFNYFSEQGFQYVQNFMFVMLDREKIPKEKKESKKNNLFNYFKKVESQKNKQQGDQLKLTKDYETGRLNRPQEIFLNQPSQYFQQSQRVLYLFRKQNKNKTLELRHQRTSDAFFTIGDSYKLDWKSMETVYKMIETLLIKANYKQGRPLKLLELWSRQQKGRKGWVTVHEKKSTEKQLDTN